MSVGEPELGERHGSSDRRRAHRARVGEVAGDQPEADPGPSADATAGGQTAREAEEAGSQRVQWLCRQSFDRRILREVSQVSTSVLRLLPAATQESAD